jgi:hypothetical protein
MRVLACRFAAVAAVGLASLVGWSSPAQAAAAPCHDVIYPDLPAAVIVQCSAVVTGTTSVVVGGSAYATGTHEGAQVAVTPCVGSPVFTNGNIFCVSGGAAVNDTSLVTIGYCLGYVAGPGQVLVPFECNWI